MDFIICNEWTKVSAVLGLQFGESFKTVACTVDFVGIFKFLKFKHLLCPPSLAARTLIMQWNSRVISYFVDFGFYCAFVALWKCFYF